MREMGHKWSQATVWAVEKGDRALKLAEAQDLAEVLGVSVLDFLADPEQRTAGHVVRSQIAAWERSVDEMVDAIAVWAAWHERIRALRVWIDDTSNLLALPESERGQLVKHLDESVRFTLLDAADSASFWDLVGDRLDDLATHDTPEIDLGEYVEGCTLREYVRRLKRLEEADNGEHQEAPER